MNFPVVVLISGRGSNMLRLLACQGPYQVTAVLSNNAAAAGVVAAATQGVSTIVVPRQDFPTVAAQKREIFEQVSRCDPKLVVLAGYMQIVEQYFIQRFEGRIINIHPSLLPDFPGLHTHARAIEAGRKEHGCSVHLVDTGVDTGTIIAQATVPIAPDDTPDTLAHKVQLEEHRLLPWVVEQIAREKIILSAAEVRYAPEALHQAGALNFRIPG